MFDAGGAAPPFAAGALTLAGATGTGVDFYRRAARGYAQTNLRGPLPRIVPTAARRFDGRATPAGKGIPPPLPASKADEGASSALLCKTGCSARVGCRNSAARAQQKKHRGNGRYTAYEKGKRTDVFHLRVKRLILGLNQPSIHEKID